MEGAGIFTLVGLLVMLPVVLCLSLIRLMVRILGMIFGLIAGIAFLVRRGRGQQSDNDVLLNRAAHPLSLLAVALVAESLWWPGAFRHAAALFLHNPAGYWLAALLVAAALIYAVASFVVALCRCTNPKDGAVTRAALALLLGAAVASWLRSLPPAWAGPSAYWLPVWLQAAMVSGALLIAVWIAATGFVRLPLLVIDGGSALRRARREAKRRNAPPRSGRF